jgi:hypothetical protein
MENPNAGQPDNGPSPFSGPNEYLQPPPDISKLTLQPPPDISKLTLQPPPDISKLTLQEESPPQINSHNSKFAYRY